MIVAKSMVRSVAASLVAAAVILWGGSAFARSHARQADDEKLPPVDELEKDGNGDGMPDGWYNFRDAKWIEGDGAKGPHFVRLHSDEPGGSPRASRAFAVDGEAYEAVVVGIWVRVNDVVVGEREGDSPQLMIGYLTEDLHDIARYHTSPWTKSTGDKWFYMSKRFPIPPAARDALLTIGLAGAGGTLDFDGLSVEMVPVGGVTTTNLVVNGDLELGDPDPFNWVIEGAAERVSPGHESNAALEFTGSKSTTADIGVAISVDRCTALDVVLWAKSGGLRTSGEAVVYFFDHAGQNRPYKLFSWSGTTSWTRYGKVVPVPEGSSRAVIRFLKASGGGVLTIDDVQVAADPNPEIAAWTPYHVQTDTANWTTTLPSPEIVEGSALDFSFLLDPPAGSIGRVAIDNGRFVYRRGKRARFFGMMLIPPTAFADSPHAEKLVDRLARSGVNLVRISGLDVPLGAGRSLFDDSRDDTAALDPIALAKFDHLIALLKQKGIYVSLELTSARKYRKGDGIASVRSLPSGGGPAAAFDPELKEKMLKAAELLLGHVNPETGEALRDDPILAMITLVGELSLFDLTDNPRLLTSEDSKLLREIGAKRSGGSRVKLWRELEEEQWGGMADRLREFGVKSPIAGCSHWRRDPPDFSAAQAHLKLDFIDDRLYWAPKQAYWNNPDRRSMLWHPETSLTITAERKRKKNKPYVAGQWCDQSLGAWSLPYEAADFLLGVQIAKCENWDAIVRRGALVFPLVWGSAPVGTEGEYDLLQLPETIGGMPQLLALLPHASSLMLRGAAESDRPRVSGWEPRKGQLAINNAFTQGIVGWWAGEQMQFETLSFQTDDPYAILIATSVGSATIARSNRLLITAVGGVEPTGFRYVDEWRREVADPGRGPFLQQPISARVVWRTKAASKLKAYALDNTGKRVDEIKLVHAPSNDVVELSIEGGKPYFHYELVVE